MSHEKYRSLEKDGFRIFVLREVPGCSGRLKQTSWAGWPSTSTGSPNASASRICTWWAERWSSLSAAGGSAPVPAACSRPLRWRAWAAVAAVLTTFLMTMVTGAATRVAAALFGATSPVQPAAAPAGGSTVDGTQTRIDHFTPWDEQGRIDIPGAHVVDASAAQGSCWTRSLGSFEPDAYRCKAGAYIEDPCWWAEGTEDVACAYCPWSKDVTVVRDGAAGIASISDQPVPSMDARGQFSIGQVARPGAMVIEDPAKTGAQLDCAAYAGGTRTLVDGMPPNWQCVSPDRAGDFPDSVVGQALGNKIAPGQGKYMTVYYKPLSGGIVATVNVLTVWP